LRAARIVGGALARPQVLALVLGRQPVARAMVLTDHALGQDAASRMAVLMAAPGRSAGAFRVEGLSEGEARALDRIALALGLETFAQDGLTGHRAARAEPPGHEPAGLAEALVAEMLRWPDAAPADLAARRGPLAVVAASRLRAAQSAPATLRHRAGPGDVTLVALRHPYAAFFAVEERDTGWRRFDGTLGAPVTRAVFVSGDAVTVLPWDRLRDRVLVVEQFRAGPQARGDGQPWQLEAVAGRIDPGETPEEAARREAVEEAGLVLRDLHFVARYYPSPGAVSEYLYSYVAEADLPDGAAGVFGVDHEAEDIRGHLLSVDRLMDLVATGEIENAPLILTALWLQRERSRL
jgi:nudix-type nucleoside diphosphatase (YffH/AdpP family)